MVDAEERKVLMERFALDREAAKARIRQAGKQLLPQQRVDKSQASGPADTQLAPPPADAAARCLALGTCENGNDSCQR